MTPEEHYRVARFSSSQNPEFIPSCLSLVAVFQARSFIINNILASFLEILIFS